MADTYVVVVKTDTQEAVKVKLVANADGTYSMAQSLTGSNVITSSFVVTAVSVPVTPTKLPGTSLAGRGKLTIFNNSNQKVEIGGAAVALGSGLPVPPGSERTITVNPAQVVDVYAVSELGNADVRVWEDK